MRGQHVFQTNNPNRLEFKPNFELFLIHANHPWSCYSEMVNNVFRPDFLISLNKLKTSNHLPAQSPEEYQALDSSKVNTHSGL